MAANVVRIDSHSAVRTSSSPRTDSTVLHGSRHSSPRNGSAKNSAATTASTITSAGGRSAGARPALMAR